MGRASPGTLFSSLSRRGVPGRRRWVVPHHRAIHRPHRLRSCDRDLRAPAQHHRARRVWNQQLGDTRGCGRAGIRGPLLPRSLEPCVGDECAGGCVATALWAMGQTTGAEAFIAALLIAGMSLSAALQGILRGLQQVRLASWLGAADKVLGLLIVIAVLATGREAGLLTLLVCLSTGPWLVSLYLCAFLAPMVAARRPRWVHPYKVPSASGSPPR